MDLVTPYHEYFELVLAHTDLLREEVFRLRYQVYCEELGWEDKSRFSDFAESDAYDQNALHCLLRHRKSGLFAGTVRLIGTKQNTSIPLIEHCADTLFETPLDPRIQPPGTYGEISRLALRKEFRRRKGEAGTSTGIGHDTPDLLHWNTDEHRRFPHISLALYLAAAALGLKEGMSGVYAMMEPRLARHLRVAGLHFEQVGEIIDFHGDRAPYYISKKALFQHLARPLKKLLNAIIKDLNSSRFDADLRKIG
jgi:N-acyl amino acid synthase of PEP-CTERM/exosortase system